MENDSSLWSGEFHVWVNVENVLQSEKWPLEHVERHQQYYVARLKTRKAWRYIERKYGVRKYCTVYLWLLSDFDTKEIPLKRDTVPGGPQKKTNYGKFENSAPWGSPITTQGKGKKQNTFAAELTSHSPHWRNIRKLE